MSRFAAVVGWGKSGQGVAGALLARDWQVRAFDARGGQPLLLDDVASVDVHVDGDPETLARATVEVNPDLVVVFPGVPAHHPMFSAYEVVGVEVWGEAELAWRLQEEGSHVGRPWLVVTGMDGKTTTVGMLGEILRCMGAKVEEAGNIGMSIIRTTDSDVEIFAVEPSSSQLHTVRIVSPLASICLNADADHLDWHGGMEAYAVDKTHVYENTIRVRVYPVSD